MLLCAVFTAVCGLAWSFQSLACFPFCWVGPGGEWATGASLVAETWPVCSEISACADAELLRRRPRPCGGGVAGKPIAGWRGVFIVDLVPALLTFWILRRVAEPAAWQRRGGSQRRAQTLPTISAAVRPVYARAHADQHLLPVCLVGGSTCMCPRIFCCRLREATWALRGEDGAATPGTKPERWDPSGRRRLA